MIFIFYMDVIKKTSTWPQYCIH